MAVLTVGAATIDTERGVIERGGTSQKLAAAEIRVVTALASGELVDRSVLEEAASSERALRRALEGLRRKLGPMASSRLEALRGHGYRLDLREESGRRTNVPPAKNALFGRDAAIRDVREQLARRPVSLVGPPGVGKSRLGREVARRMVFGLPGGVWWVSLSGASTSDDVVSAVAGVLDIPLQSVKATNRQTVLEAALPHVGDALLVLDDIDSVADLVGPLLDSWHLAAPQLRLLSTCRRPLENADEQVVRLSPLEPADALALLTDRVGAPVGPLAARIAEQLDHLPLALELVAARLALMGAESLLATQPTSLVGSPLDGAIDASVADLDLEVAHVLGALAVFPADFSQQAALAVAGPTAADALVDLERRSLVERPRSDGRYALLHAIRQRVRDTLLDDAQNRAATQEHARFFADLGAQMLQALRCTGSLDAMEALAPERDNLLVAAAHEDASIAARAMVALSPLVGPRMGFAVFDSLLRDLESRSADIPEALAIQLSVIRGINTGRTVDYRAAAALLEVAHRRAEALGEPAVLGRSCTALGSALLRSGDQDRALALHRRGAELAQSVGHQAMRGAALVMIAENLRLRQDLPGAIEVYRTVLEVAESTDDLRGISNVLANWGGLAAVLGLDDAEELLERAAEVAHQLGDRRAQAYVDGVRARLDARDGNLHTARQRVELAVRIQTELGLRRNRASSLVYLGELHVLSGEVDSAAGLYREALQVHTSLDDSVWIALDTANLGLLGLWQGRLAEARRDVVTAYESLRALGHRHAALAQLILAVIEARSANLDAARAHFAEASPHLTGAAPELRVAVDAVGGLLGQPISDPDAIEDYRGRSDIVWLLASICERGTT